MISAEIITELPKNFQEVKELEISNKFEKNLEQRGIEVMAPILVEQSGGNLVPEQVDESTGGSEGDCATFTTTTVAGAPHPPPATTPTAAAHWQ